MAKRPSLKVIKADALGLCGEADDLIARIHQEARNMDRAGAVFAAGQAAWVAGVQSAWADINTQYADIKNRSLDLTRRMEACEESLYLQVDDRSYLLGGALWAIGVPSAAAAFIALTGPAGVIAMWGGVGSAAGGGILFGKDLPEVTRLWRLRVAKEGILDALDRLRLAAGSPAPRLRDPGALACTPRPKPAQPASPAAPPDQLHPTGAPPPAADSHL